MPARDIIFPARMALSSTPATVSAGGGVRGAAAGTGKVAGAKVQANAPTPAISTTKSSCSTLFMTTSPNVGERWHGDGSIDKSPACASFKMAEISPNRDQRSGEGHASTE